jgi:uncharacterized protein YlaI
MIDHCDQHSKYDDMCVGCMHARRAWKKAQVKQQDDMPEPPKAQSVQVAPPHVLHAGALDGRSMSSSKVRASDPDTSRIADSMMTPERKAHLHRLILEYCERNPLSTQRQVWEGLGEEQQSISTRFSELEDLGLILMVRKIKGVKNRPVQTYRITTSEERLSFKGRQKVKTHMRIPVDEYATLSKECADYKAELERVYQTYPKLRALFHKIEAA